MRSLKEIRKDQFELTKAFHDKSRILQAEEKEALKHKQETCPHPAEKIRIEVDPGYYEHGRMRGPAPDTHYKKCKRCGLRIAMLVSESKQTWQPINQKVPKADEQ